MQNTVGDTIRKGISLLPPSENTGFIEPETAKGYFFLLGLKYLQTIAGKRFGALAYNDSI